MPEFNKMNLDPSQVLVIAGLLGGVLKVDSVLVDRDQVIEVRLLGSLKVRTDLDRMLDKIGTMPFDDVLKSLLGRII